MSNIILISGKARSGKNTFSTFLKEYLEKNKFKVVEDAFAKSLKELVYEKFSKVSDVLKDILELAGSNYYISDKPSIDNWKKLEKELTLNYDSYFEDKTAMSRALLEIVGTDIYREADENFWVLKLLRRTMNEEFDFKLVTDVRFTNEIEFTKSYVGSSFNVFTVRINREEVERNTHISNTALDDYWNFDYIEENNGTLEELKLKAEKVGLEILSKKRELFDKLAEKYAIKVAKK